MKTRYQVLCWLVALIFSSLALLGDTVELRNGEVVKGHFISADRAFVKIKEGEVVRTFRTEKVLSIKFASSAQPSPAKGNDQASSEPGKLAETPVKSSAATPAPPPAPVVHEVAIPAGTYLAVRMIDPIDTDKNQVGDSFAASIDEPVTINDQIVIPKNTIAHGRIMQSKESGKISGAPELRLELTDVILNNHQFPLRTGEYAQTGEGRGKRSAEMIGGGAALGAVIGAIAGKGKGVAIGAASGAAAGTAVQVLTKGKQLKIPSETLLRFQLQDPVTIKLNSGK